MIQLTTISGHIVRVSVQFISYYYTNSLNECTKLAMATSHTLNIKETPLEIDAKLTDYYNMATAARSMR